MQHQPIEKPTIPGSSGRGPDGGSTLLPMLIVGLLSVTLGGLLIMVFV